MLKIASISLALALSATASVASAQSVISTVDLGTPHGVERFERDLRRASQKLCNPYRGADNAGCRADVRAEALDQLSPAQLQSYLAASQNQNVRYAANTNDRW